MSQRKASDPGSGTAPSNPAREKKPKGSTKPRLSNGHTSFGEKLRALRKSRQVTLQELADKAEISPGLLSQIERGITSPSLRTLAKLRTTLGVPSSFFFDDDHPVRRETGEPAFLCRAADRPTLVFGPEAPFKELLHHGGSRVFEFMMINIPPNGRSGPSPMSYPSEKGGMVMEGSFILTVGGQSATLEVGDSFLFDGAIPHLMVNPTDQPVKLLWIIAKLPNTLPF